MAVTQVNRENVGHLDQVYELLLELGVRRWTVHLCQATGRAHAARGELLCEPADLERVAQVLVRAARERAIAAPLSCSIGYLTAEELLRSGPGDARPAPWSGCSAGLTTLAVTSRGGVKGCTTLPDEFVTGSLADRPLAEIWRDDSAFPYTRARSRGEVELSGPCARCDVGGRCRAGCLAVGYGATGAIGANPFCLRLVRRSRDQ
jgi:radical SAM protein with 4Fe4S-binding SPASM domain